MIPQSVGAHQLRVSFPFFFPASSSSPCLPPAGGEVGCTLPPFIASGSMVGLPRLGTTAGTLIQEELGSPALEKMDIHTHGHPIPSATCYASLGLA